jgi:hypothetical protein
MELHEALSQITEIRLQMARTEVFRGYRAMPVAFSGLLALASSCLQAAWIPEPMSHLAAYLSLWTGAAVLSAFAAGTEMVARSRRPDSLWSRRITWLAVEQFVPCLVAGGLLTAVLVRFAPEGLWMLPGLWQILFSLGVFASCRLLPKATFWIAVFYLAVGLTTLMWAHGDAALSPWAMGLPFGIGQLFAAVVLYRTLESKDAQT